MPGTSELTAPMGSGGAPLAAGALPQSDATRRFEQRFGTGKDTDLKGKTIRGGAVTVTSQVAKFVLYTFSSIILGRLLTPQDYGVVGMVTAVTGFLRVFNYGGLSTATVQRKAITHELVSTIFWINVGLGVTMTVLGLLLAPGLVWFYRDPRLYWVTIAMTSTFLLDAGGAQHMALMRRQMQFKRLAILEVTAMVIGIAVAVSSSLWGLGLWSLVLSQTVSATVPLFGAWLLEPWRPGLPSRGTGAQSMIRFGGYLTGTSLLNYVFRNIDNVLIGWRWGAGPLGFYQKAYGLLMLPVNQINSPITSVAVATLSRLTHEKERQRRYFIGGYSVATAITIPIVVTAAIFAPDVIPFLVGNQWTSSVRLFQLLAPAALIGALVTPLGWLFVSVGRTDRQFKMQVGWTSVTVAAFVAGLKFGPEGVATGFSLASVLLVVPMFFYAVKDTPVQVFDLLKALRSPFVAILVPALLGFWLRSSVWKGAPLWVRAVGGPSLVMTGYAFVLLVLLRQWDSYRELLAHLRPKRS